MATSEGRESPPAPPVPTDEPDVIITTVVAADEPRPGRGPEADAPVAAPTATPTVTADHAPEVPPGGADDVLEWAAGEPSPPTDRLAPLEQRLAAVEGVPATVEAMGKAIRHELERCAGVLFGHDRALGAIAGRLDALEARAAEAAPAIDRANLSEETMVRVLDQFERLGQRVNAAEARVEPLEPLPTLVQALRRAVRASDDLIAGERAGREQALDALAGQLATEAQAREDALRRLVNQDLDRVSGIATAQAKGLADLAERVAGAEAALAPLAGVPDDVAALGRILRRELDAVVSDNQARDQMLRRALQNEVDQIKATSEAREGLAREVATRVEALETRSSDAGARIQALEDRLAVLDRLSGEVEVLRETVLKELEQLRTGGQAADQVAGELTRRVSALDGRMARLDSVPGEVQSLRTALLQEAERTVVALRTVDERVAQLAWVPGEFQEARKRILALTTGLQSGQDKIRQLEGAVATTSERLDALRARLSTTTAPPAPQG